jgi:hypothetical protein
VSFCRQRVFFGLGDVLEEADDVARPHSRGCRLPSKRVKRRAQPT